MTKQTGITGWLLSLLAGMLLMWGLSHARPRELDHFNNPAAWDDRAAAVPVSSSDPIWGSRFAPVTIVAFGDYQCPPCKRSEEVYERLKQRYGGDKLRIIWKHNPLAMHPAARPAAEAGAIVHSLGGSDAFWKFHERVFASSTAIDATALATWAEQAGVDKKQFLALVAQRAGTEKVKEDLEVGAEAGVRAPPAAFINGVFKSGYLPDSEFTSVIDAELAAAEDLVRAGTPADQIYVTRSLANKPPKGPPKPKSTSTTQPDGLNDKQAPSEQDQKDNQRAARSATEDADVFAIPVGSSPARGPADALVTIIEFGDVSSRLCANMEPTLDEIDKLYPGKVRLVWKHFPMAVNARALPAALLAQEAKAEKGAPGFWEARRRLLQHDGAFSDADLMAIAADLGLDATKVKAVLADGEERTPAFQPGPTARAAMQEIERDAALAADFDVASAPHFFINGRRIVGAQPLETMRELIDAELKRAEALASAGVAKGDVYAALIKDGKGPELPALRLIDPPASKAPTRGPANAKVELHAFIDFECAYCKRAQGTLTRVDETFGKRIKLVFRDAPQPTHKVAPLAAQAAREAFAQQGTKGFFAFHDQLFAAQGTAEFDRPGFERIAEKQGLDMAAFRTALAKETHKSDVDKMTEQAKAYELRGTPAFVVTYRKQGDKLEGYWLTGAVSFPKLKKTIELALTKAQ